MATMRTTEIEGLQLSFEQLAEIPDAVVEQMLVAGGNVIAAAHRSMITRLGLHNRGLLASSITVHSKVSAGSGGAKLSVLVYPGGVHHLYSRRAFTRSYTRSKHGRTYTVGGGIGTAYNSDIGFVFEYGAPGRNISPKEWMKKANNQAADTAIQAEYAIYDAWLKSINL